MNIKIDLECDNEAFDSDWRSEAARILKELARAIDEGREGTKLKDINGNTVGKVLIN